MNELYDMLEHGGDKPNHPKLIVVHSMGEFIRDKDGKVYSARDWLDHDEVSAHRLIHPDGNITVCRADNQRAWHARGFNTDSLGIEFLCQGIHNYGTFLEKIKTPYVSTEQLFAGIDTIKDWMAEFGITDVRRHSDIAPGRKFDPGTGFQWLALREALGLQ